MSTPTGGYTEYDVERCGGHGSTAQTRSEFEVDKGRVIHSAAFRRLQGKTQALGTGERDFYRTRLTHSLEVSQLSRGLCQEVDREFEPNQDLVEVICLAHDIGHPPFGHSGERILHEQMRDEGGFGANPQNLRIVTLLETKFVDSGLDLTRATLDGLVKYPKLFNHTDPDSKFTYAEDEHLLAWIKLGLKNPTAPPLEGQIADWADQMAYCVNDIEDAIRSDILDFSQMRTRAKEIARHALLSFGKHLDYATGDRISLEKYVTSSAVEDLANDLEERCTPLASVRVRKANLKDWTSRTIKLLKNGCRIVEADPSECSVRYRFRLQVSEYAYALAAILKSTTRILVFEDPRIKNLEANGCHIIAEIYSRLLESPDLLPEDFRELLSSEIGGSVRRVITDFIAGMTDQYAYTFHKQMAGRDGFQTRTTLIQGR